MASVEEMINQDAAPTTETEYDMSVGDSFEGVLEGRYDEDWIRVELVEGEMYDIRLSGIGPEAVIDTVLTIYNSDGKEIASNDDIEVESLNLFSMLEFSPDTTGVYYISAGAYRGNPTQDNSGRYQVAVYEADTSLILTGTRYSDYFHTRLTGSIGDDELDGKGGWDWLEGGAGVDILIGGPGNDSLDGGEGVDTFVFAPGGGHGLSGD